MGKIVKPKQVLYQCDLCREKYEKSKWFYKVKYDGYFFNPLTTKGKLEHREKRRKIFICEPCFWRIHRRLEKLAKESKDE